LTESGYEIVRDEVVKEGRKYYDIIVAQEGKQVLSETQIREGAFFTTPDAVRKERLERKLKFFESLPATENNRKTIYHVKEALKWQN
jgi:tRNA A22 N-methylase